MPNLELAQIAEEYMIRMPASGFESATFLLTYHRGEHDMPFELRPKFEEADIVFHERPGWQPESIDKLNGIAQGDTDIPTAFDSFNHRLAELVQDTGKPQASWDVPLAHLSAMKFLGQIRSMQKTRVPTSEKDFELYYQNATGRDKLALRTIGIQVDKAVESGSIPESPRILVIAGMAHLLLANAFKNAEPERVAITSPFGETIPLSSPVNYIKQRLEGATEIDMLGLKIGAINEEMATQLEDAVPSHTIVEQARQGETKARAELERTEHIKQRLEPEDSEYAIPVRALRKKILTLTKKS